MFLRFLSADGHDGAAILQQLERPKPERSLPKVLSRAQVNQLIAAPNPKSPLFARDVAILELLYASGLRASELCDLKLRDVNLQVGCVRVLGKGMKERIVPLGRAAAEAVTRYLAECRPKLDKPARRELLFLSRTGKPLERIGLWMLVEKYGRTSGLLKTVSPHTLRHCFATHLSAAAPTCASSRNCSATATSRRRRSTRTSTRTACDDPPEVSPAGVSVKTPEAAKTPRRELAADERR